MVEELNRLGADNGIGRADLVESRVVGMKSRGVYETPAGTILYAALADLEMITLDAETAALKNALSAKYADAVYQGKWFTSAREAMEEFMKSASRHTTGEVKLVLYKGNIIPAGRKSKYSLYSEDLASFGASSYDHKDATGFLKLYALPTQVQAKVHGERALLLGASAKKKGRG
jgi:argininosuccinate synthase